MPPPRVEPAAGVAWEDEHPRLAADGAGRLPTAHLRTARQAREVRESGREWGLVDGRFRLGVNQREDMLSRHAVEWKA